MGDRASISFSKDGRESVALFSHWRGKTLRADATQYAKVLKAERNRSGGTPLDRLDPETVIVDFIRFLTKDMSRGRRRLIPWKRQ